MERAKKEIVDGKVKMTMVHEDFFTIFAFLMGAVKIGLLVYAWRTCAISIGTVVALMSLARMLLLARRLNAVSKFDRIVVFRDGQIEADGTFGALMADNEYFRELYLAGSE